MENGGEIVRWLLETCSERLGDAVETMAGERPRIALRPAPSQTPAGDSVLWWEQPLSLGEKARVWIGAPETAWLELGNYTLRSAGIEPGDPASARNTYLDILGQALAGLAQSIGARLGLSVTCENGQEAVQAGAPAFEIELTLGAQTECLLYLGFAPALLEPFEAVPAVSADTETVPPKAAAPDEPAPKALELLLDVELPVSVSFGRAQLPLKDVLKLTTGSIVELNRAINEPVEVIVNNCVIARGEVVVIDGNYGVRIREIISRDKRMRTLK